MKSKIKPWFTANKIKPWLWMTPIFLMTMMFLVVPFFTGITEAFKVTEIFDRVNFTIGIKNFETVIGDRDFNNAFYYSNIILFLGVPLGFGLSLILAFLLNSFFNKIFRSVVVGILFSQFFISGFAIGIAFIYLFDTEKAAFNLIFGTRTNFTEGNNNLIVLVVFHLWRIWPFNTVIFLFHFTAQKKKYTALMNIDRLTFADKVQNIYFQKIRTTLILLMYINILQALLLNPVAIYTESTLRVNNVSTFSYYIYYYLKISPEPLFGRVGAASVLTLSYLLLITFISIAIYYLAKYRRQINQGIQQLVNKIKLLNLSRRQ
ncbi:multiple sugar transport system permease protein [Mycoplasmoides fastidiosum]|uniref:Multiple sugar transport system permease protein n=1 Tax=Mycoplasmoides fastidiosum TaxID=92758 RepID=A0ABU0LZX5_9BACT|nr:hypothetical protein [Mycoplasmoides fastidiosum]MDQ0514249.1 multiple sugar transport system permease protein [Mycoplasmoides fastidiosum]UUD37343.1 hypothetical protein NPA10_02040 [Mycoplasmoides fastidiosum]